MNAREFIQRHEGRSNTLYKDSRGLWTIGYGRLIDPTAGGKLSDDEIDYLFQSDIVHTSAFARQYDWFTHLSDARQAAILDLLFNLGPKGFATFVKFISAMAENNFEKAASELESSLWYKQVKSRGPEVVALIRTESWPTA